EKRVLELPGFGVVRRGSHAPVMLLQYTGRMTTEQPQYEASWNHHYEDERDAAWLYRKLAAVERDDQRRELFVKLAEVEDQHSARWEELFAQAGHPLPPYAVSRRTKLLAWIAKTFGPSSILPL